MQTTSCEGEKVTEKFEPLHGSTSREILELIAGYEHGTHSIVSQARSRQAIQIKCTCGQIFSVPNTEVTTKALRHVPMAGA